MPADTPESGEYVILNQDSRIHALLTQYYTIKPHWGSFGEIFNTKANKEATYESTRLLKLLDTIIKGKYKVKYQKIRRIESEGYILCLIEKAEEHP